MAVLHITSNTVGVEFTLAEKILGLLRDFTVHRNQVLAATVHADSLAVVRGLRAPGFAVPGRRRVGTWRRPGHRTVVAVSVDMTAIRLLLHGHRYDELVLSHPDAAAWAAALDPAQP